jgi:hypothetical protein
MKNYYTPDWLHFSFSAGISIAVFLIAFFAKKNAPTTKQNLVFVSILLFFSLYFTYIFLGGKTGLFQAVSLPPKILLLSTFPYAILLFGVIINLPITKKILENATLSGLVGLHIFRLVGLTFIVLALYDALPKSFAFLAGFGDIITAISSIFVVKAIKNNKKYAKTLTYIWNTFGLIDILTTAILANILTKISIDTGVMGVDSLAKFPFSLIPAFAPPTIIFLHVLIYKKLKKKSN